MIDEYKWAREKAEDEHRSGRAAAYCAVFHKTEGSFIEKRSNLIKIKL